MLGVLASCNNTSGPLSGLTTTEAPKTPVASDEDRKAALKRVAVDLEKQKKQLKQVAAADQQKPTEINVAKLRPAVTTNTSLLSPKTVIQPGKLKPVPGSKFGVDENETVASIPRLDSIQNKSGPLGRFHAKLSALKSGDRKKPITILHIGDSHVASDSFTRGIRNALQARYGDAGRGMVIPARAFKYGVADQVTLKAVGNWRSQTALKRKSGRFGLSGVNVSSRSSRSSMVMKSKTGPFDWAEVTVATGPSQGAFFMKVGTTEKRFDAFSKSRGSKNFRIDARGRSLTIRPGGGAQTTILNWSSGKNRVGIRYINFGLIGATVDITRRFDTKLLENDVRRLDPDLIIYGYGTNEGFNDNLNLSAYSKRAKRFVNTLRASAPNADIVYLGAASGLRRKGNKACGGWSVPPKLAPLRANIRKIAEVQKAAYWDWSSIMGGACGVNAWAKKGLAAKDRVHLSSKGYRLSAKEFANWLMRPAASNVRIASN